MDVRLVLNSGRQKGRETMLARGIYLVGRSRICQIRPKNRYVSRKHCALIHRRHELLIQDLGSKTGTYVNGMKIDPKTAVELSDGDRIRVGKTKFRVAVQGKVQVPKNEGFADLSSESVLSSESAIEQSDVPLVESDSDFGDEPSNSGAVVEDHSAVRSQLAVDDLLKMLEDEPDDEEDDDGDVPSPSRPRAGTVFALGSNANGDIDVDDDDDSEDNVIFAAPKSSEGISALQPLPSYSSRKDWDVQSVYSWINQKETYAKLDERRAKRKAKQVDSAENGEATVVPEAKPSSESDTKEAYSQKERIAQEKHATAKTAAPEKTGSWSDWLDSDTVRPVVLVAVGIAFASWLAWNVWVLISFKG